MSGRAIYSVEPAKGWLPWAALAPVLGVLFVAVPLVGVSSVLEHLHFADGKGDPIGLSGLFAVLLFPFALVGLVVLAWAHSVERRSLASIGLTRTGGTWTFLRGHATGITTSFAVVAAIWLVGGFVADGYAKAFRSSDALPGVAVLLFCFAVQSSMEEVLFRGWLLATGFELPVTGLDAKLPPLIEKLTASGPTYLTGGAQGPEGSLACTLFFACAIAYLAWSAKRSRNAEGHIA